MIDINELRQALGAVQPEEVEKLLDRLEAAEKERNDAKAAAENIAFKLDYLRSNLEAAENAQNDWLRANAPGGWIDNLRIKNEALQAKIEATERQEPVGTALLCARCSTPFDGDHYCPACGYHTATEESVYVLPGAKGEEK